MKEKLVEIVEIWGTIQKCDDLESRIAVQEYIINGLLITCENIEQYSRRNCLRIHGIECSSNINNEDVTEKVKDCYKVLELPFCDENIDRAHGIRK